MNGREGDRQIGGNTDATAQGRLCLPVSLSPAPPIVWLLAGVAALLLSAHAHAGMSAPECIAPAKPGGGFDLTCRLVRSGLEDGKYLKSPMRVSYMPGGVGAVAYDAIVAQRPGEGNTLVAFSGGSLLNLAQAKFGKYTEADVRWLAAVGLDCGMFAVRADSPFQNLSDLVAALNRDPTTLVFGVGGSMGGQDWVKAVRVAQVAGIDPKTIRYVSFEGGGEAFVALLGGHVQVVSGDILEAETQLHAGRLRVLAVFAEQRLPGRLAGIPTAKEQGFAITWPDVRGVYMGPKVADADYGWWVGIFNRMLATPAFAKRREESGLFPLSLTGAELTAFVKKSVREYGVLAQEFGLIKP